MRTKSRLSLLLAVLALAGCDDSSPKGEDTPTPQGGGFESDLIAQSGGDAGSRGAAAPTLAGDNAESGNSSSEATRAIVEADVIQMDGDKLYTLSQVAGLTVIDAKDPAKLAVLGRYRELNGTPFEMYLRNGVVLAMYAGWGQYVKSGDDYVWVQTSKVLALDVHDPAAIARIGSFDVAGDISDSRIVGDVMYVVGYENGYCWSCVENQPRTTVLSLNVADPRAPRKVDELHFADSQNQWGWNKRSITVTDKRMYVAGPEYGTNGPTGSSIQVVDISDPAGDLVEAAVVKAAGQISSRWQMDEYDGVLRVVSQFPAWWQEAGTHSPRVQTYRVESSASLQPLGETALVIPKNEMLMSARFDGPRGYAITAERTDPLFTIDLSDPAHPKQMGELVMPGWVYHMEPRGNRVLGLGYDQGNPAGSITVSLFDVSDLSKPTMLDRVNFGGNWGSLPEDQDRIHKAFRVLAEQNLITVPFTGWTYDNKQDCPYRYDSSSYRSGIQLVDYVGDDLVLRGAAPSRGNARRAIVRGTNLLAVSDEAVDSYDITQREAPKQVGKLDLAHYVQKALQLANGNVARVTQSWYQQQTVSVDLVSLADVERPEKRLGQLDLAPLLRTTDCASDGYIEEVFAKDNLVYVLYQRYGYSINGGYNKQTNGLIVVDASDAAQPKLLSNFSQDEDTSLGGWSRYYRFYDYGYQPYVSSLVQTDRALVYLEQRGAYYDANSKEETRLRVVDLSNPAQPRSAVLPLNKDFRYSGLIADGANVMFSHYEASSPGKARFYLDRVDLTDPLQPKLGAKINVPGAVVHNERAHGRVLTSTLHRTSVPDLAWEQCYARFAYALYESAPDLAADGGIKPGTCVGFTQALNLVKIDGTEATLEGSYRLADNERLSNAAAGDARFAGVISRGGSYYYGYGRGGIAVDCWGRCWWGNTASEPVDLLALGGFETGVLASGRLTVQGDNRAWWGWWSSPALAASGTRALVLSSSDAAIVDLSNVSAPTLVRTVPLYAGAGVTTVRGNVALVAQSQIGVQRIDL